MAKALRIEHDPVFGCVRVLAPLDRDGYGMVGRARAHIKAYVDARGPIEGEMEVDHLCRRRNCIALHHLELVTRSENEKRKSWRYRARRKLCPVGHDMKLNAMTPTPEGGVVCRACNREAKGQTT